MTDPIGPLPGPGSNDRSVEEWERVTVSVNDRSETVLVSPPREGADRRPTRRVLPARPHLARDVDGRPRLSVVMLLTRQPRPSDDSIRPLIQQATLQFESTIVIPPEVCRSLECDLDAIVEQVYADPAEFALLGAETESEANQRQRVLATAAGTGTGATAAMSATVDQADALALLDALYGRESSLSVRADVTLKSRDRPREITIYGEWATIHDHLGERIPEEGFTRRQLREAFDSMVEADILKVTITGLDAVSDGEERSASRGNRRSWTGSGARYGLDERQRGDADHEETPKERAARSGSDRPPSPADDGSDIDDGRPPSSGGDGDSGGDGSGSDSEHPGDGQRGVDAHDAAFDVFLDRATLVLRQHIDTEDGSVRYRLRSRPPAGMSMNITELRAPTAKRTVSISAPLETVLNDPLTAADIDAVLSLVSVGSDGRSGIGPVPERVETRSSPDSRSTESVALASTPEGLTSVASLTSPSGSVTPSPRAMSQVQLTRPRHLATEELHAPIKTQTLLPLNLPIIDDMSAPIWRDRYDSSRFWYLPEFVPVEPDPNADAETAPFEFTFERIGATSAGEPALRATVRIELESRMSDETAAALEEAGDPRADPVFMSGHSVSLEAPYIDEDGELATRSFAGDVTKTADGLDVEWTLRDDWVRLCYGSLAIPDFQQQPPQVRTSVEYTGYREYRQKQQQSRTELVFGNKSAVVAVRRGDDDRSGTEGTDRAEGAERETADRAHAEVPYFDADTVTLHTAFGRYQFDRESRGARSGGGIQFPTRPVFAESLSGGARLSLASSVSFRPRLQAEAIEIMRPKTQYVIGSFHSARTTTVSYPCEEYSALYREVEDDGPVAVGCQDALALGQTDSREYTDLPALRTERYSVKRSLAQPDRFLVVPRTYRIARRAPGTWREYEPSALVYAVINDENPEASKVVFEAGLLPDLPAYARHELRNRLTEYVDDPVLEYPTDVFQGATYTWTISRSISDPVVVENADHLRISVTADLVEGHLLRRQLEDSGVFGRATFELRDGRTVSSDIAMELDGITGPWETGPIECDRVATGVRATNRVARPVAITELRAYKGATRSASVPVEETLAPDESTTVMGLDSVGEDAHLAPVYTEQPGGVSSIEESRIHVEDVTTNVIFVVQFSTAARHVESVDVRARLRGVKGTKAVSFDGDPPTGEVEFSLPLTTYLDRHILEFRTVVRTAEDRFETDWLAWDIHEQGAIVSLTWGLVAQSRGARGDESTEPPSSGSADDRRDAVDTDDRPPSEQRPPVGPDRESIPAGTEETDAGELPPDS